MRVKMGGGISREGEGRLMCPVLLIRHCARATAALVCGVFMSFAFLLALDWFHGCLHGCVRPARG